MALLKKDKKSSAAVDPKIGDYAILDKPVITEKSGAVGGGVKGGITFRVDRRADKLQIKAAVERIFKVKVDKIRTLNYIGKQKRTMKSVGRRAAYKKAYVTLKEGFTINLVEGV